MQENPLTVQNELEVARESLQFAENGWKNALKLVKHYQSLLKKEEEYSIDENGLQMKSIQFENEKLKRQLKYLEKKSVDDLIEIKKAVDNLQITSCSVISNYQQIRNQKSDAESELSDLIPVGDENLYKDDISPVTITLRIHALSRRLVMLSDSLALQKQEVYEERKLEKLIEKKKLSSISLGIQTEPMKMSISTETEDAFVTTKSCRDVESECCLIGSNLSEEPPIQPIAPHNPEEMGAMQTKKVRMSDQMEVRMVPQIDDNGDENLNKDEDNQLQIDQSMKKTKKKVTKVAKKASTKEKEGLMAGKKTEKRPSSSSAASSTSSTSSRSSKSLHGKSHPNSAPNKAKKK